MLKKFHCFAEVGLSSECEIVQRRRMLCAAVQVKQFSCKSVEMSLRVASLDYLGIVAARLRKDAVSSRLNEDIISDVIKQVCIMLLLLILLNTLVL